MATDSSSSRSSGQLYLPLRGAGVSVGHRRPTSVSPTSPPISARVMSVQDVPDDLTDEDDLYQPVTPTPASRQLPPTSRSSLYGVRVSMAPEASTRRTTWMGERDSKLVPDLPTTAQQRRASSALGLEVPMNSTSSARSSRTLIPNEVPFAAGPIQSTPNRPRVDDVGQELHISLPDPEAHLAELNGGDSRASTVSTQSRKTTSTTSSFGNGVSSRLAPTHPSQAPPLPKGVHDLQRSDSNSWISLSHTSLAPSTKQHSLLSKPSLSSFPRVPSDSPPDSRSVASSSGRPSLQRDDPSPPSASATVAAAPPTLKLDFGADTSSFFGESDFFADLGLDSGLASTLGSNLSFGAAPSSSLASSQRTVGPAHVTASTLNLGGRDDSPTSPVDATGSLSALSEFPRIGAHGNASASSVSVDRQTPSDLLSRSRTPSVPASPADSRFSHDQHQRSASTDRSQSQGRSFDLDGADVGSAMKLSPELEQKYGFAHQQQAAVSQHQQGERSRTTSGHSSQLAYRTHQRKQSGSGSGASVSSDGRGPPSHHRLDSLTSPVRASSPLSSSPKATPPTGSTSSAILDFMKPASLKRRRSNASMLNIVSNAAAASEERRPSQSERAQTTSPYVRPVKTAPQAYGSINKSLPPTPRHPPPQSHADAAPPPAMPRPIGIDTGSLRKSAVIALKKSKGLLRTKGSTKPSDPSAPLPASSYPYPSDDTASIASSIEIPIQMPAGRQPESPYAAATCFPRGPNSASRSSSSIMPRESNESKRSTSQPLVESSAFVTSHQPHVSARKSLELLRRGSDASSIGPSGPRPLPVQPVAAARPEREREREKENKVPEPRALPRQPTTDQLLMLATAKLQALVNAAQAASANSTGSSRESFPTDAAAPSSDDASNRESSASSPGPAEETAMVGKAIRVQRGSESPTSPRVFVVRSAHGSTTKAEPVQPMPMPAPRPPPPTQKPTVAVVAQAQVLIPPVVEPLPPASPPRSAGPVPPPKTFELPPGPYWVRRELAFERKGSSSAALSASWSLLETSLQEYQRALEESIAERTTKVTVDLLPFLKRVETGLEPVPAPGPLARHQRDVLFGWLGTLLDELRDMPANRGVCLEGVAAIVESRFMAVEALAADSDDELRYRNALVAVLSFAIDRLNEKAVYANTLAFSGRMLALAFFRIEGVGIKLLRLLPQVKRLELRRIIEEAGLDVHKMPEPARDIFPPHLDELCFRSLQSYCKLLSPISPNEHAILVASDSHQITMSGNWLIRWCASDSDLPFAFYRAYHRQIVTYLRLPDLGEEAHPEMFLPVAEALTAPGYLFVAASLLEKAESLIHRNMRSVTTLGPNSGTFNTLDSATLSTGAKPKVLEMANRRVVSSILDIIGGPAARSRLPGDPEVEASEGHARRRFFGGMLQIWVRAVVKRTSLFDARGIFILLDFLESLFFAVCSPAPAGNEKESWKPSVDALILFDVPFVLSTVQTVMTKADNTVGLMRTIAFLYSLFDVFTLRLADREQLCDNMLLQPELFQRMFLYWNTSVRGYFQRLVVWRLSRLGQTSDGRPPSTKDPWIFQTLQTLNLRLEAIRKRHNELDPLDDLPDDDLFDSRRASVSSTRGVTNQPWAVEELKFAPGRPSHESRERPSQSHDGVVAEDDNDVEPWKAYDPNEEASGQSGGSKGASKVVNWLKLTLNTTRKALPNQPNRQAGTVPRSRIDPFALDITMPSETVDPIQRSVHSGDDVHDEPIQYAEMPLTTASTGSFADTAATSVLPDASPTNLDDDDEGADALYPPHLASSPGAGSFFKFEFETEAPQSDAFDARKSTHSESRKSAHGSIKAAKRASLHASAGADDADSVYPGGGITSPIRKPPSVQASPRVSKRFSKRTSILPPPAFDLLFETSEPVPAIPAHFRTHPPYELRFHPYAVRGLREYEESLDELEIWLLRVKDDDEELADRDLADLVPRLGVAWPISFDE